ncbi:peptidylprolyl isomerase [Paenibacillus sp. LHD-117]|uniref:peptidylprolyl isomerase n=1 Tax=Paenibacillus sp. LHD-117 TaxID=3071412 RepID=UPI0027DF0863|nr:peptidylprolyl isomerase [Paenibacillus sp. LHD-117]MDQ6423341.1 peptidylprolyl isomerase [Paenibacillus sp. LHD-117]
MNRTKRHYRHSLLMLALAVLLIVAAGCGVNQGKTTNEQGSAGGGQATSEPSPSPTATATEAPAEEGPELLGPEKHPEVTIEMSNGKLIKIELYPEVAPNTVNNFIALAQSGYYDGLIFHRVIPGFMIQGGDPDGTGMGGPGYSIAGEFKENGFDNKLKHTRGVISMARSQMPDSAGSQFFIMAEDYPSLDNLYAAFGKVIEGIETVDEIVAQERDSNDKPLTPLSMKKVTVDIKGMTFDPPVKVAE